MKIQKIPTVEDIHEAHQKIRPHIHRTPTLTSLTLDEITGNTLFFKCENFQKIGAFKFRGALNAVLSLDDRQLENGVTTHSSGNHAQALALAAKLKGVRAYIVMPSNSPKVKIDAVDGYGAEIIFCEPTLDSREKTLDQVVNNTKATFIHPYDDFNIISGQATCAKELLEDHHDLDFILAPVGGGGLLSGTALSTAYLTNGKTKVIACEPEGADDAFRSFQKGEIVPSVSPKTIADGLLTSLGHLPFAIIMKNVADIVKVSEDSIIDGMRLIWERMKIVIEPSAAVTMAALIEGKLPIQDKKIGIILSGGNVDLETFFRELKNSPLKR